MTTNQMDILAGVIVSNWYSDMDNMSYRDAIKTYESIRKELSYWNEVLHDDEGRMEDECDK